MRSSSCFSSRGRLRYGTYELYWRGYRNPTALLGRSMKLSINGLKTINFEKKKRDTHMVLFQALHSQGKLAKRAKKRKFSEMIKSELFQDNLGPVNPKIILILYFEVIFTPYGPLKGKNLEKTVFFMVNCLGFLYMIFYIINVVIFLNYLFFSIKSFLNHQSKFFGF